VGVIKNALSGMGFDQDASMVVFPVDVFVTESDISPVEKRQDEFVSGLIDWKPAAQEIGMRNAPMITIEGDDYEDAFIKANHQFLISLWGDGFPVVPPTEQHVSRILLGTDLPRDHIVGKLMPRGGIVTVETAAVALAMAGGRPEYLPILLAAIDAILEPDLLHDTWQSTSAGTYPVVVVNGPIAKEIRLNSGYGILGPDPQRPAGAAIGRAMRMLQQNVGGAVPGIGTMSVYGQMRFTNAVFAEDEEGLPEGWQTFAESRHGRDRGANTVSVFVATGASNIHRRGVGRVTLEDECRQSLCRIAGYMRQSNFHYLRGYEMGTPGAVMMPSIVAKQLAEMGWTQESIKQFLWEESAVPQEEVQRTGLKPWIEEFAEESVRDSANDDPWHIARRPENLIFLVAGGSHPPQSFWMQANSRVVVARELELPKNWHDLLVQSERDLGCASDVCLI